MSTHKKFLPNHPRVVKKITSNNFTPSMTFRSSQSDIRDLNSSFNAQQHEQVIQKIIKKQQAAVQELEDSLNVLIEENCVLEESVKFYDNQKQLQSIRQKIRMSKLEQQQLIKKIQNCEKVEQTTTPQQYYLWQKKKKTEQFNKKIEQALHDNHEQKNNLLENCSEYEQQIRKQKSEIVFYMEELQKLKSGESDSDKFTQLPQVDQDQFDRLKEDYKDLSSSIDFMKESNQILTSQLEERIHPIKKHLNSSFTNYKSGLLKDLQNMKRQIEDADPEPPIHNQKDLKVSEILQEYQRKMEEIQLEVTPEQAQEISQIIQPFDWKSLNWEQYAMPSETLKQTQGAFTAYHQIQKQNQEYTRKLEILEEEILKTVTDTMEFQQRSMELQEMINRMLRLSMSMSVK